MKVVLARNWHPLVGAFAIAYWVGIYAFVFGVLFIALGFRLRSWVKGFHAPRIHRGAELLTRSDAVSKTYAPDSVRHAL